MAGNETLTVDRDEAGMRLDRWFKAHYPDLSFGHLQKLLRSGQVRVDGGRVKTNTRLEEGQAVRVPPLAALSPQSTPAKAAEGRGQRQPGSTLPREGKAAAPRSPDADFLRSILLYEDDDVYVFNKPAGLAVQGGSGLTKHVDGMLAALTDRKGQKPRLVHRLDRETSGVLIVARTRLAASKLAASFRARSTRKIYWALVKGVPRPHQGRISTYLAREDESERMRVARHGDDEASHAVSLYSVVETAGQALAWLSMRPVTGRTHQLRAHAAHIGHPIIGDSKYFEADNWELPGGIQNKLHLHARRLVIPHPSGSGAIDVTAPLPPHMQQSWNLLGFDARSGDSADHGAKE
jgi:23S rRNA pseudouridine955/2504/2580 synthase